MVKEIYTRSPQDPNFRYGLLEFNDTIESILTKLRMIFGTKPGQVLGDYRFGIPIEDIIFQTNWNKTQIQSIINDQIREYVKESLQYKITAEVKLGKSDEGSDYALIDISINEQKLIGFIVD